MKASGIGGQALMEGVMMKNGSKYACAVRKPDGEIEIDIQETKSLGDKCKVFKWPIIRGVVTFIESLVIGVKTLMYSASFFDEEEDASENKKGKSEKKQNSTASETDEDKSVKTVTREKKEKTAAPSNELNINLESEAPSLDLDLNLDNPSENTISIETPSETEDDPFAAPEGFDLSSQQAPV